MNEFYEKSEAKSYKFRIDAATTLHNFLIAKYNSSLPKYPTYDSLLTDLDFYANYTDMDMLYCPPNPFDEILFQFLESPNFDLNIRNVLEDTKHLKFASMNNAITSITQKLSLTREQFIVLKSSFIRYCFDKNYEFLHPYFHSSHAHLFAKRCAVMTSYTPSQLDFSRSLYTDEQMKAPLRSLKSSRTVREIVERIRAIEFVVNPLDMLASLSLSLQLLNGVVRENDKVRRFGRFAGMIEGFAPKKYGMMNFDDCFSLFCAMVALEPPVGGPGLAKFIAAASFEVAQSMKFAQTIFSAAIEHITVFSWDVPEIGLESVDPLGIMLE
jgi:hypothetical protein